MPPISVLFGGGPEGSDAIKLEVNGGFVEFKVPEGRIASVQEVPEDDLPPTLDAECAEPVRRFEVTIHW